MKLQPKVQYADLTDDDITAIGLGAAEAAFLLDVQNGLTNGDSLIITVGHVKNGTWNELGRRGFGPDPDQFAPNIDAETGKLATALQHEMESIAAYQWHGDNIPEGPQRFTGGVCYAARVKTVEQGWMIRTFAGAASGVQGHIDMATVYTAVTRMGAAWALKMQELYGKAA